MGTRGERGPTHGVRDKRGHVGAHSLARTQLGIAARGASGSPIPPCWPSWIPQLSPSGPGDPQLFSGWGAPPLQRGAGGSVAVWRGWEQWVRVGHGVRPALSAPSTGCRGAWGPAGKQDAWGARARGLGQAQGWGLRSPGPQHPGQRGWDQHPWRLQLPPSPSMPLLAKLPSPAWGSPPDGLGKFGCQPRMLINPDLSSLLNI